ncbi:MAG TPA: penicillin-binding protein 2 [Verrucomicrobiae bacterium]|nr:penicillin-binding protein 2 [Verrucomicrobiae bacterium]
MILPPDDPNLELRLTDKPPLRDDTRFAAGKIAIFQYTTVGVFLVLISGFWRLQVQNPQFYLGRAEQNSIKSIPIPAPRGRILDRDGRVIVGNYASYKLNLQRENLNEAHLRPIAQGLDLDYDELVKLVRRYKAEPKYRPIPLKEELTQADLAFVASHQDYFRNELELVEAQQRLYPRDGMLAHVIGYTGQITQAELDMPEFSKCSLGDVVGQSGIEREYNSYLTGVDGERQVMVNSRNKELQRLGNKDSIPGKDLQLTIDLDLQAVAELAMQDKVGGFVALDPRSGEILAMVSRPTFDPSRFRRDFAMLTANKDNPLLNRAIQAQLAPGSTFKPIVGLAALEEHERQEESGGPVTVPDPHTFTVNCPGYVTLYGAVRHCWWKAGHGAVQLHHAIVQSCDSYFFTLGDKLGIDILAHYGDLVGFGKLTGVDLPGEKPGLMPSREWSTRVRRQKYYAGETPSVAVGQGALTVTPLQLARAIGGIAVGGTWFRPHLLKNLTEPERPVKADLDPENVTEIVNGMYGVVNEGGTGAAARLPEIEVCGKTGSAQVASIAYAKSAAAEGSGEDLRDNAWFVAFAPRQDPEIVAAVLVEHGVHGGYEADVVRDVLKAYFDKKARVEALKQREGAAAVRTSELTTLGLQPQAPGAGR